MDDKMPMIFSILILLLAAGCPGQREPIAPEEAAVVPQPPVYTCPDGTTVSDLSLCEEEKVCTGTAEDYCMGEVLMHNAHCVDGAWSYDSVDCAYGCVDGACAEMPEPEPTCEPESECLTGSYVDGECVYEPVEDGAPCGQEGMQCVGGECVMVVVEPEPISEAALNKLRACEGEFTNTYRYTESDGLEKAYEVKISRTKRNGAAILLTEYGYFGQVVAPEYDSITVTDVVSNCACFSRQLVLDYKTYGGRSASELSQGGTCGELPGVLSQYTRFWELADPSALVYEGEVGVNELVYMGMADKYHQETNQEDGSVLRLTYWLADIIPVPVRVRGNSTAEDGTMTHIDIRLLP